MEGGGLFCPKEEKEGKKKAIKWKISGNGARKQHQRAVREGIKQDRD